MPPLKATPLDQSTTPADSFGRDEMNLAEFPLSLLTDTARAGQKTLYFEDSNGRLTVTGSDAYGLPTASDADVIVALLCLTKKKNDFTDAKVNFTKYELLKILGWADEGDSYRRLDQSFNRWSGVLLIFDKCWWDNRRKKYVSAKMHILETVVFADADSRGRSDAGELPLSTFTWNQTFIQSCQADNLRSLDLDVYRTLKSSLSKRLYRFLGKRFYKQDDWTFDLKDLAFERVGMSRSYADAGKIKEKLQPALKELEAIGFLEPLDRTARYLKIDKGQWTIRLSQKASTPVAVPVIEPAASPLPPLVAELMRRGVTQNTAETLVADFPVEAIGAKLEEFDFLVARNDPKVSKSPAGYLVKSIRIDYAVPKGFVPKAERERREAERQAKEDRLAASRRADEAAAARDRAELAAIDGYWNALTPEQQAELDAAAQAGADPETLKLAKGPMKRFGTQILRREFIRQKLQAEAKPPALAE